MKLVIGPIDPDDVLAVGGYGSGALIRCQWATSATGTFADLTGSGSTPTIPVVSGDRFYYGWHPNGTATTYYRVRLESTIGLPSSEWSVPFLGQDNPPWYITSTDILTQARETSPTAADTDWAEVCAAAVNGAIGLFMADADTTAYGAAELYRAALMDGVGAYADRNAPHGVLSLEVDGSAIRLGADILRASWPVLRRHAPVGLA
jgi:hypothetical protein